jgi:fatty acid desaturase
LISSALTTLLAGLALPALLLLAALAGLVLPALLATLLTTLVLLATLILLVWITHCRFPRLLTHSGDSTAARDRRSCVI